VPGAKDVLKIGHNFFQEFDPENIILLETLLIGSMFFAIMEQGHLIKELLNLIEGLGLIAR